MKISNKSQAAPRSIWSRYGYRRIWALLSGEGWRVNLKPVWGIWRRDWLKVPQIGWDPDIDGGVRLNIPPSCPPSRSE